jgi:hypothetical protein
MSHKIAPYSLDFAGAVSSTVRTNTGGNTEYATIDPAIKVLLGEIRSRLDEAARIARAAEACALAGNVAEDVVVSMDMEQMLYEAGRLQDAASLLNRLSRD